MATYRSDSSAATTLTVNITEIGANLTMREFRVDWSVTLGSATSLGSTSNRTLYIKDSVGGLLAAVIIKNNQTWNANTTYSGSFNFYVDVGTYDANTYYWTPSTSAESPASCVFTQYVTSIAVASAATWTPATPASACFCTPATFETNVTFNWTKGVNGVNNNILQYYIKYRYNSSAQTAEFGGIGDVASHIRAMTDASRGDTLEFCVRAITQRGDNPYSVWSSPIRRNRLPYAPTSPSVPKTSYLPGEAVRVSFANNGDPDNNLAGFEVATDADATIVGTRVGAAITYVDVNTTGWAQGTQRRFRVRAYDSFGIRSGWSAYTALVTFNTPPNASIINFPVSGSTVYNQRPRILMTAGARNDGPENVLVLHDTVSEKTTAASANPFSCGVNVNLESNKKVVYKVPTALSAGSKTMSTKMFDGYLYTPAPLRQSRQFSISTVNFTDPDISTPGMKIKAVHITELQTRINLLRAAYGLTSTTFTPVTAGVTGIGNATIITQLQTALQAVINVINGWDTANSTFDISVTWINPAASGGGVERVKLRQAIEQLRTMIKTI